MSEGIVGRFLRIAGQHSKATAVVGEGGRAVSYAGLEAESARVAAALREAGVGPGHFVPVVMGRSLDFVRAVVGIVRCGAAYVPIDPAWPRERQTSLVAGLPFRVGIGGELGRREGADARWTTVAKLCATARAWIDSEPPSEAPLYIMFTSGSTGIPKGVVVPHRGVDRLVRDGDYAEFKPGRRWAFLSSTAFDASTLELWGALLSGGTCVVFESSLPSIDEIADGFRSRGVTDAWLTAALFHAVVEERLDAFEGCRQILTGGEVVSPRHARRFLEVHPTVRLINGYGPTENTTFSLCHRIRPEDVADDRAIPIGRPIAGTTIRIVSGEGGRVEAGAVGELLVGGEGVALGYWNDPDRTAERFVRLEGEEGWWYRTGDLVRQDEQGIVHYLGRLDRQVKIRGHRVEPEEIERHLLAHSAVRAAVVEVEGETAETRRLVAFCEIDQRGSDTTSGAELRRWLLDRLPAPIVPAVIEVRNRLVRTASGKIDRASTGLRATTIARSERDSRETDASLSIILDIARSLLPDRAISADSDFIAEGGDSLRVLRLVALIRRRTGCRLAPSQIFAAGSLRDIARLLPRRDDGDRANALEERSPPSRADRPDTGSFRLTATARSLFYEWRLEPTSARYHEVVAFRLPASVSPDRIRDRVLRLLDTVPVLRSVFSESEGTVVGTPLPTERVAAAACPPVVAISIGDGTKVPAVLEEAMRAPFDLERTGPFRAHVGIAADRSVVLGLAMHHAIIDEWALERILSLLEDEPGEAPGTTTWELDRAAAWEERLADRPAVEGRVERLARVAASGPVRPWGAASSARSIRRLVDPAVVAALARQASRLRVTTFALLLGAFARTLSLRFATDTPVIATPFSLRGHPECAEVISCLTDLRLLAFDGAGTLSPPDLARAAADLVIAEHDVASCPLDALVAAGRRIGVAVKRLAEQFGFTYRENPRRAVPIAGEVAEPIEMGSTLPRFGLLVQCERQGEELAVTAQWAFDGPEVPDTAAEEILDDYVAALRWIAGLDTTTPPKVHVTPMTALPPGERASPAVPSEKSARFDAPPVQEDLEICAVHWSRALRLGPDAAPDPAANFFDSGGSSLDALRLAATLRRVTGREIDLGAFVARPTLGRLARLLGMGRPAGELACYTEGVAEFDLIGIPGLDGSALSYRHLWPALARQLPSVIGFRCMDFLEFETALVGGATVGEVSARAADRVRRAVGSRPYGLVAYSLGGLLAIEIAARLDRLGHPPAHVVFLDCYSAVVSFPSLPVRALDRAARSWFRGADQRPAGMRDQRIERGRPDNSSPAYDPTGRRLRRSALADAFRRHTFSSCRADATLIVSAEAQRMPSVRLAGPRNGLAAVLGGRVEVHMVSIPHRSFLTTGAHALAESIAPTLSRVIAAATSPRSKAELSDACD